MSSISVRDPTFSTYTAGQAAAYARSRPAYTENLLNYILEYHQNGASTLPGTKLGTLLDVGCGPGNSTRDFARHFQRTIAIDGSAAMIEEGRHKGGSNPSASPSIRFECKRAEECGEVVEPESVDILTSAMAAHWFDMDAFWPAAAKVLKPGGTVALWCRYKIVPHPSIHNGDKIRALMEDFDERVLGDYYLPGNRMVKDAYVDLPLPWTISQHEQSFDATTFQRKEWNADEEDNLFEEMYQIYTLQQVASALATNSAVTRWREAHAGQQVDDCLDVVVGKIKELLEGHEEQIRWGGSIVLLLFKKRQ